jgi:hypothetical protein
LKSLITFFLFLFRLSSFERWGSELILTCVKNFFFFLRWNENGNSSVRQDILESGKRYHRDYNVTVSTDRKKENCFYHKKMKKNEVCHYCFIQFDKKLFSKKWKRESILVGRNLISVVFSLFLSSSFLSLLSPTFLSWHLLLLESVLKG